MPSLQSMKAEGDAMTPGTVQERCQHAAWRGHHKTGLKKFNKGTIDKKPCHLVYGNLDEVPYQQPTKCSCDSRKPVLQQEGLVH